MAGPPCSCPLGNRFLAALPLQVSLLWTALPPLPVEVANRTLPAPQSLVPPPPPHHRRLEWEGARILEAGGLGGREGFASVVLCLGSWLFRSDSSLLTRLNEDNLVPGWVGSHLKRHRVRTGPEDKRSDLSGLQFLLCLKGSTQL